MNNTDVKIITSINDVSVLEEMKKQKEKEGKGEDVTLIEKRISSLKEGDNYTFIQEVPETKNFLQD